ncbi:hypothetical protein [Mameliella sediminis]|uniref:hypothetical protein n=1 Tax=Mameliella sediminis TaxID=2836866 RepID=UPI001C4503B7|nr:hypothetical protein [Mameliella sediminis]MBV7394551.1 hypothetical protein [Mameliella sediminis]
MTNVYAWPPVGAVAHEWTRIDPVEQSRSLITGRDLRSATQRARKLATVTVGGVDVSEAGAGYMEILKRLLAGQHAVRLYSWQINRESIGADDYRQSQAVSWEDAGGAVTWEDAGGAVIWITGRYIEGTTGTDGLGFDTVSVTGAPPGVIIARPGEFLTVHDTGETVQIVAMATTDAVGAATIRTFGPLTPATAARVSIGTRDTAVFFPIEYPRAMVPVSGQWFYTWKFREVFEDEVSGSFNEIDPW